jgi:hypothetical protein
LVLTSCFSFGSTIDNQYWTSIGFRVEEHYGISSEDFDAPQRELTPRTVLETIASSCKEYAETALDTRFHPSIQFVGKDVTFTGPGCRLEFASTAGWRTSFMIMCVRCVG